MPDDIRIDPPKKTRRKRGVPAHDPSTHPINPVVVTDPYPTPLIYSEPDPNPPPQPKPAYEENEP
jgi:hypothetical protein